MSKTSRLQIVLDLDNTIISSLTPEEVENSKDIKDRKLDHKTMDGYYRVFARPHIKDFMNYIFKNFDVSVWTAASREYANFIINNFITEGREDRRIKMFLFDKNCKQSQKFYNKNAPKDLRYLFKLNKGHRHCNTIIIDDHPQVLEANPNRTISAPYFDANLKKSEKDTFLKDLIPKLEYLKEKYEREGCDHE